MRILILILPTILITFTQIGYCRSSFSIEPKKFLGEVKASLTRGKLKNEVVSMISGHYRGIKNNKPGYGVMQKLALPFLYSTYAVLTGLTSILMYNIFGLDIAASYVGLILGNSLATAFSFFTSSGTHICRSMGGMLAKNVDASLDNMVQDIARSSNIKTIKGVWIIPDPEANAFATGIFEDDSHVAITSGLRNLLKTDELKAVIAHECGHIKHRDVLYSMHLISLASGYFAISGFGMKILENAEKNIKQLESETKSLTFFSENRIEQIQNKIFEEKCKEMFGYALIGGGLVLRLFGNLFLYATSRNQEFLADRHAAQVVGRNPMISALKKISEGDVTRSVLGISGNLYNSLYIYNPPFLKLSSRGKSPKINPVVKTLYDILNLFHTHPTLEDRIANIKETRGHLFWFW